MIPRPGGEADKFGNRYEEAWTVRHLLLILAGKAESITVEDMGDLAQGVEFTFRRHDAVEVHQLKRQNGTANYWSVKSLQEKGIWANVRHHVEAGREFYFISTLPAVALQTLAGRARQADSVEAFETDWLTNQDLRDAFTDLCSPKIYGSPAVSWKVLRGFWIDWPSERSIVETNATVAELHLEGATGSLAATGLGNLIANST